MADERTPLLQVVRVAPQRERYTHSTIRRFCTTALACTLVAVIILFLVPLQWLPGSKGAPPRPTPEKSRLPHSAWPSGNGLSHEELLKILLETPDAEKARDWSKYYTSGPHLAGQNLTQAVRTQEWWEECGVKSEIVAYHVYINYPAGHSLKMLEKVDGGSKHKDKDTSFRTLFEASLEEDVLEEDPTTGLKDGVPTFHGYSASGNVTAQMVYVNFCTFKDFEDLVDAGIELEGRIALCKYGRNFRGLKVKRAQELGMIGVVMYDDPQQDGEKTEQNGYKPYPEGPARNPSAVQRGSVQYLSLAPGDPTTPGYPSLPGVPRQNTSGAIPDIPSLPISNRDALPLLKALNGHGPKAKKFNKYWQGGGLAHKGVKYNIGPSDVYINLVNKQDYVTTPLWNVIGVINGTIPDEVLIVGNHRDGKCILELSYMANTHIAWLAGGAGDPNSGSAAMNEMIRSFGEALKQGWRPLRTIVFASWDGEEYGLIGSTEWVEEYLPWLSGAAVAYLNVDVGTRGPHFTAAASPLLNRAIHAATRRVPSPNQTVPGQSVHDLWDGAIRTMGSGSDFTAFQDFAGVPSLDVGFNTGGDTPVYHYHSNYDSFYWMDTYGDPGWVYHATMAKVWGSLTAYLAERPVLPLSTGDYAQALGVYLNKASTLAQKARQDDEREPFPNIRRALADLGAVARRFDAHADALADEIDAGIPWWKLWKRLQLYHAARRVNTALKRLERQFLHPPGLESRPWFKHVVFAPGLWTGYAGETFPGLIEAIERADWAGVARWSGIVEVLVDQAAKLLRTEV